MLTESDEEHKHSIILVEDDLDVTNILGGHFTLSKYKVHKALSAQECLDKLKELDYKVDVIFINGTIAADRGPMLIVNIRKRSLDIKIFALAENENNKTRVLDYGADEFAIKPISPTTVVEKISMLLMKKPLESQIK